MHCQTKKQIRRGPSVVDWLATTCFCKKVLSPSQTKLRNSESKSWNAVALRLASSRSNPKVYFDFAPEV